MRATVLSDAVFKQDRFERLRCFGDDLLFLLGAVQQDVVKVGVGRVSRPGQLVCQEFTDRSFQCVCNINKPLKTDTLFTCLNKAEMGSTDAQYFSELLLSQFFPRSYMSDPKTNAAFVIRKALGSMRPIACSPELLDAIVCVSRLAIYQGVLYN